MKQLFFIIISLSSFLCFSQEQKDSTIIKMKIKEVTISATKTSKSIDELPIPVTIISKKEIKEFSASKLYDVITKQTGIISVPTKTGTEGLADARARCLIYHYSY